MRMNTNETAAFARLAEVVSAPRLKRGGRGLLFEEAAWHAEVCAADPVAYGLMSTVDGVSAPQRARVAYTLLTTSWAGMAEADRALLDRVTLALLCAIPTAMALQVLLGARQARANHKHTRRAVLRYLLDHPALPTLLASRRPAVRDCVEHVLGRNTARAIAGGAPEAYVRRNLLRHVRRQDRARSVFGALYERTRLPKAVGVDAHLDRPVEERTAMPKTVTAFNRGPISGALVQIYRGGPTPDLVEAVGRLADEVAAEIPRFEGRLGIVLDASESTRGYGEREYCCVAQTVALTHVLRRCCEQTFVCTVGGQGAESPVPTGSTDLASAVLDLLDTEPDLLVVVTDGYENAAQGDLADVVAALPAAGIGVPVVLAHSKFTDKDDLTLRRPAPALPEVSFWHQDQFDGLIRRLFAMSGGSAGAAFLRSQGEAGLRRLEEGGAAWQ